MKTIFSVRRFVTAVLIGVLFPIVYTILAGLLSDFAPGYFGETIQLYGHPAPGPIFAPTLFPVYFDSWLRSYGFFGWWRAFDAPWFRIITLLVANFFVYSSLGYLLLSLIGFPSVKPKIGENDPPPPEESQNISDLANE